MNLSSWAIICSIIVSSFTVAVGGENANSKKNNSKNQMKDKLTIDDEDAEGSGFGESQYDLESSGSGYGPDDEDGPGSIANVNLKSGKSRSDEKTFPMPTISSTAESISSSSSPMPKHISESSKPFDEDLRKTAPNKNKDIFSNHGVPNNNNLEPVENENHNREIVPRKGLEEDGTFDNRHPDDKVSVDEDPRIDTNVGVYKVNTPDQDRATSFFAQPGILAAVIGGAVVGLLCAILVVMFIVYRMRKKDEGSYPLEEMKRCPANNPYMKPNHREFFA